MKRSVWPHVKVEDGVLHVRAVDQTVDIPLGQVRKVKLPFGHAEVWTDDLKYDLDLRNLAVDEWQLLSEELKAAVAKDLSPIGNDAPLLSSTAQMSRKRVYLFSVILGWSLGGSAALLLYPTASVTYVAFAPLGIMFIHYLKIVATALVFSVIQFVLIVLSRRKKVPSFLLPLNSFVLFFGLSFAGVIQLTLLGSQ